MKKSLSFMLMSSVLMAGGYVKDEIDEIPSIKAEINTKWEHTLTLYGWLPTFNGTFKYTIPGNNPGDPEQEGESSALDSLDMVFMGSYEIRKERWSFLADVIYLGMSADQNVDLLGSKITLSSEQELTTWMTGFYGGYDIVESPDTKLDIIAGIRYFSLGLDVSLSLNNKEINISPLVEVTDAVVGIKGEIEINQNWYIPYLFDIGGGDSDLTWQAEASIGYRFSWGDILATYRYIHYEKDESGLIEDFNLYGPKIGLVFHF